LCVCVCVGVGVCVFRIYEWFIDKVVCLYESEKEVHTEESSPLDLM
jgi:hypothetical protein